VSFASFVVVKGRRFGEVARSSAAWSWRWRRAGPGFPSCAFDPVSGRSSRAHAPVL